jgi:peptide/nickel transport system substrate-binding protein
MALKGLEQPVEVVAVHSDERDTVRAIAPHVAQASPVHRPTTRRVLMVGAAALVLVATLVIVPQLSKEARGGTEIPANSVGVLDPESGEVTDTFAMPGQPGAIVSTKDAVWVANPEADSITKIAFGHGIIDTIQVGKNPTALAVGDGAVWVVESGVPSVSRIVPTDGRVVKTVAVGNGPVDVAVDEQGAWVTNRFDGTVSRIDPATGEIVQTIPVGLEPTGVAIGFGAVWVSLAGSNSVVSIDPETNSVTQSIGVGNVPSAVAVDAGSSTVWVANTQDDTVAAIDPDSGRVTSVVEVGNGPSAIAVGADAVWVSNEADGTLSKIEPTNGSVSEVAIGTAPQGLVVGSGDLWITVGGTATTHRGGMLRLVAQEPPTTLDSAVAFDVFSGPVQRLVGDGLVGFKAVGGIDGTTLVPDLATSLPGPTDGGRTYTFQVRLDIAYSTGEIVAPSDFRRAIERGFALSAWRTYASFYGGIIGAATCRQTREACVLSEGIETDDAAGTMTFHLVEPDPEFLYKLAMPFAYPIPPSVPNEEMATEGTPGTGPYMLAAPLTPQGLTLVRNPHFRVWAPEAQPAGNAERIEWTFGIEPQAQIEAVAASDADVAIFPLPPGQLEELFVRYAGYVHAAPIPGTFFFTMNTAIPPFDDIRVRRAINLAVDREQIVEIIGGNAVVTPTCQQIPPNFPGYERYCPYTIDPRADGVWSGPDLAEARRLIRSSGTAGVRVTYEYTPAFGPWSPALAQYMVSLLEELGYRTNTERLPVPAFYDPGNEFQIALAGWASDYPAASNFIVGQLTCVSFLTPEDAFCDPAIDAMVDHALEVQADDPAAAGELWAEIDRSIVDQATYVWLVNGNGIDVVADRVGNYQRNPQWGPLLSQLWVR